MQSCAVVYCLFRKLRLSELSVPISIKSRYRLETEPTMFLWSKLLTSVLAFSVKKVWELSRQVTMLYLSSECSGAFCLFMEDGTTLELRRWFFTFSTKTCFSLFLNLFSHSTVDFQDKQFSTITILLSTTWFSPRFHLLLEPSLNRTFTL